MSEDYSLLRNTLELDIEEGASDEQLLLVIERRVTEMLTQSPDLLFSYLYRLDISEKKIKEALYTSQESNPNMALAQLILTRQKQRIETKKKYKQDPIEGWEF
jgi:hypothetical protein